MLSHNRESTRKAISVGYKKPMDPSTIDETGKTYHHWYVRGYAGPKHGNTYWHVTCTVCGHNRTMSAYDVRKKKIPCVGCKPKRVGCKDCGSPDLAKRDKNTLRSQCNPCYLAHRRALDKARVVSDIAVENEVVPRIDAAPIRRWLESFFSDLPDIELARMVKTDDTTLGKLRRGVVKTVSLDTADRIFCGLNSPGELRELYPEVYVFSKEQMIEAELWAME